MEKEFSYGLSYSWDGIGVNRVVFAPIYSRLNFWVIKISIFLRMKLPAVLLIPMWWRDTYSSM